VGLHVLLEIDTKEAQKPGQWVALPWPNLSLRFPSNGVGQPLLSISLFLHETESSLLCMSLTHWIIQTITSLSRGRGGARAAHNARVPLASAPEECLEIGRELPDPVQQRRIGKAYQPPAVALPLGLRRRHLYGTGTVGSGKTSFALQLMDHDIAVGMNGGERGVGCMDPEGDLIDRVLRRLCGR
jgi:hypothetical protein